MSDINFPNSTIQSPSMYYLSCLKVAGEVKPIPDSCDLFRLAVHHSVVTKLKKSTIYGEFRVVN